MPKVWMPTSFDLDIFEKKYFTYYSSMIRFLSISWINKKIIFSLVNPFKRSYKVIFYIHWYKLFLQVSDEGTNALAQNCSSLTELIISSNYGITGLGLVNLIQKCNQLQRLDIGSTYVKDNALEGIRRFGYGKNLKEVRLFNCPNVSVHF